MSIFTAITDAFPCSYPRVSPIRAGFNVAACVHLDADPTRLALLKQYRVNWVSIDAQGLASTEYEQNAITNYQAAGIGIIGLQGTENLDRPWPDSVVSYHTTINEPNSNRFWTQGPEALVSRYAQLKQQHGRTRPVIGGNLSWISSQKPEQWVKDLWRYGANGFMDVIGIHCYEGGGSDTVKRAADIIRCYRQAGFNQPVWVTEFGFNRRDDEKKARWMSYCLSKFSRMKDVIGASIYELGKSTRPQDHFELVGDGNIATSTLRRIGESVR